MIRRSPACKALMEVSGPPESFKPFFLKQTEALPDLTTGPPRVTSLLSLISYFLGLA